MCSLILFCLFSLYTKDLLKYKNRVTKNILFIKLLSSIKKNFIYNEKFHLQRKIWNCHESKISCGNLPSIALELWH